MEPGRLDTTAVPPPAAWVFAPTRRCFSPAASERDRQHDRDGLGGGLSGEPRSEGHAGFALMENERPRAAGSITRFLQRREPTREHAKIEEPVAPATVDTAAVG
jgi:hypothetical protein